MTDRELAWLRATRIGFVFQQARLRKSARRLRGRRLRQGSRPERCYLPSWPADLEPGCEPAQCAGRDGCRAHRRLHRYLVPVAGLTDLLADELQLDLALPYHGQAYP
jgi:hypothetical protein